MKPKTRRALLRAVHIALGVCIAAVIYLPTAWSEPLRFALGAVAVPATALTGLVMWQGGRLTRALSRRRRNAATTASETP